MLVQAQRDDHLDRPCFGNISLRGAQCGGGARGHPGGADVLLDDEAAALCAGALEGAPSRAQATNYSRAPARPLTPFLDAPPYGALPRGSSTRVSFFGGLWGLTFGRFGLFFSF